MEESIIITITDVFATTKRVIVCLSDHVGDDYIRNSVWKNRENYELTRINADGYEDPIPLDDPTISYTNEIPAVIFIVRNMVGDELHLLCKSSDQEFYFTVGYTTPEEKDSCEKVLELMSGIPGKVNTIDESVQQLTREIPSMKDLLNQILERVNTNPEEVEAIEKRIEAAEQEIVVIETVDIPRMDESIKKLEGSRTTDSNVLQTIEEQLKESKEELAASAAQGETLVTEVFDHWQENLAAFEDAMQNPDIQPQVKEKIQELRSYIGRKISEISVLRVPIANNPVVGARVAKLKANTISSMNEVLGSIGYLKRSIA